MARSCGSSQRETGEALQRAVIDELVLTYVHGGKAQYLCNTNTLSDTQQEALLAINPQYISHAQAIQAR